ncbi:MAG: DUF4153 domain-containing protein [Alphaproteobacteria bacterium]
MGIKNLMERLLPFDELYDTVKRFPLSVFCSVALFFIGIMIVHDVIDDDEENIFRLISVFGCCYFWFGVSTLVAESRCWLKAQALLLSLSGFGAIAVLVFTTHMWGINLLFLLPALLLMLMFAPYLTKGDDLSVWFFNRMIWFGVIVSYAALILFAGGLSVALSAINILFDVDIEGEVYADIWLFASLVLGPIYALSWVPKRFEFTEDDCHDPPGLKFIMNWISAPMVFVYLLILYAYFIKILITGDVPNGHLAYMITGFVGAGVVTYLASFPLRNDGAVQLRFFHRIFFPALIIPVCFHFYAIWERVSAYGITESRYMIVISAIWFVIIALGNSFTKLPIKIIPMTLSALMILASFGPWSGVNVSGYSQSARLEVLLIKNGLLVDGQVMKVQNISDVSWDDRKNISSVIDYLCNTERYEVLRQWFEYGHDKDYGLKQRDEDNNVSVCINREQIETQLGFPYIHRYLSQRDTRYFNIWDNHRPVMEIKGFDVYLDNIDLLLYERNKSYGYSFTNDREFFGMLKDHRTLILRIDDRIILEEDIGGFIEELVQYGNISAYETDLPFKDFNTDHAVVRLFVNSLYGEINDDKPEIDSIAVAILLRLKDDREE